ncbi:putative amino-acid permease protein YxeN [bioreactor metagenome]|uniref:Putative amino-acid permease protein YxeN n=1 Tax=bioreactor metagenome TaxID=1076179 RepID=A0A645EG71_9ZZZZ
MIKFEFDYFIETFPIIMKGFWITVSLAALALVVSVLIGFFLAAVRYYKTPVLKQFSSLYTSFFRSTPFICQLFVFYYGVSQISEYVRNMSSYTATAVVLSLSFAAYMGENIRGAIMSVDKGQFEAGISIGLTPWQVIKRIIIPQAARVALPGMGNSFANLLKSTSLCFIVGVKDMMAYAKNQVNITYRYLEGYVALLLVYLALLALCSYAQSKLENHMNKPYVQEAR